MKTTPLTVLVLGVLVVVSSSAFAAEPCESTVLAHAIQKLLNSDNCQESPCKTLGGAVLMSADDTYQVVVQYNGSGNLVAERYEQQQTVKVKKTREGCTVSL